MTGASERMAAKVQTARQMAAEGQCVDEIASALRMSYSGATALLKRNGIETKRKKNCNLREDTQEIVDRFVAGEQLASIGREKGITRERVRQIVKAAGALSSRERVAEKRNIVATIIKSRGMTIDAAKKAFPEISRNTIRLYCRDQGVKIERFTPAQRTRLDEIRALVEQGVSIHKATRGRSEEAWARYHLAALGVKSKAKSRWSFDAKERMGVLQEAVERGLTRQETLVLIEEREGRKIRWAAVLAWADKHAPELAEQLPRRRTKRYRPAEGIPRHPPQLPKPPKVPELPIEPCGSVKETAAAYYGKRSAGDIADALGVSRNSIIGHWFRARESGLIGTEK